MEILLIFNSSILPLFIIIAAAFIYNRIAKPDISQVANIAITVFVPVFVFDSLVKTRITFAMMIKPVMFATILTSILMALAYGVARLMKANEDQKISIVLASSMINVGNFGLPLIFFTYGDGVKVYSVLYFVAFGIPLGTVAIFISSKEKNLTNILKDIARIPIFHATLIALIVTNFSISLPEVVNRSVGLVGQAAIPLIIFILGLQLSNIRIRPGFVRLIIPPVIIRLLVSPFVAYFALILCGITGLEQKVAVIQTSTPPALLPLMYLIRFNRCPDLMAATIFVSTLLSGISLAVLIGYLG